MSDVNDLRKKLTSSAQTLTVEDLVAIRALPSAEILALLPQTGITMQDSYACKRETLKAILDAKNAEVAGNATDEMIGLTKKILWLTWIMGALATLQLFTFILEWSKK